MLLAAFLLSCSCLFHHVVQRIQFCVVPLQIQSIQVHIVARHVHCGVPKQRLKLDHASPSHDEVLCEAAQILIPGVKVELNPVEWESASLLYSETPNKYLWSSANQLLDLIEKLAKKIVKFIKTNNLYGNIHK